MARDSIFFQTSGSNLPRKLWKMDSNGQSLEALDIEMGTYMSLLGYAGDLFYFYNYDEVTGGEPWVSDGTNAATRLLKDINPGSALSRPHFLAELGGKALLIAYDEMHWREPWISDGTSDGTFMLKDINPGPNSSRIWDYSVSGERLFFNAEDGSHGRELWVTDGTTKGTHLVKDINPGEGDGYPYEFFAVARIMYFGASDGAHGYELWRTDGTKLGTWMVKDINPGGADSGPHSITPIDSGFLFTATDGVNGRALWFSDGSELGTVMIKDIVDNQTNGWGRPLHPMVFDNRLFFRADDGIHGSELWATRGSSGSTSLVAEFVPGTGGSFPKPLGIVNNRMFVKVSDASSDDALWILNEGSEVFQKIPDVGVRVNLGQRAAYDGIFVFSGRTDEYGDELWISDGTPEGTQRVTDIAAGPASSATIAIFGMIDDYIIFSANDGSARGTCCGHGRRAGSTVRPLPGRRLNDVLFCTRRKPPLEVAFSELPWG
ncbi:MAG: hypothetical protein IIB53_15490 [Planctomycetes bacterium]|nr:hypothetical protein [Planctomycetota bacterium]